jgi:hypothetical protein
MKKIKRNMVKCKKCGSIIESTKRVGIVKCSCGSIFIEGGKHYLKRGGNKDDIIEMTEYEEI